jgi:predicted 3-demethylubiquinone-9 3-methyltransferase (glyoxalase superfamily)
MTTPEITPFLMFEGRAEEAMTLYVELFGGEVVSVLRYGPGEAGAEGSVNQARFRIRGQEVMCIDSPVKHAFTFTPAISLFVTCRSEEDLRRAAAAVQEGEALMPIDNYGFSTLFTWVADRFGVSWQLNQP